MNTSVQTWIDRIKAVAKTNPSATNDFEILRSRIIELYLSFESAPSDVHHHFAAVREAEIQSVSRPFEERINKGKLGFEVSASANIREIVIDVAAMIRALDRVVIQQQVHNGPIADPMKKWLVKSGAGDAYLVPRFIVRPTAPSSTIFNKRALIHHRILPKSIGDFDVVLTMQRGAFSNSIRELRCGAALFSGIEFVDERTTSGFIVKAVKLDNHDKEIKARMRAAYAEICHIVVFPELTMSGQSRDIVREEIQKGILHGDHAIDLTVAGSFHEMDKGQYFNVATVFDDQGNILVQHKKLLRYVDRRNDCVEGIELGDKLTVLVRDDALLAFGICRDFCERVTPAPNPYTKLPVDLYVVTSTGNQSTMTGHLRTAQDCALSSGGASLVVQQAFEDGDKSILGYFLAPCDDDPKIENVKTAAPWTRRL